jgi:hypothetical protein
MLLKNLAFLSKTKGLLAHIHDPILAEYRHDAGALWFTVSDVSLVIFCRQIQVQRHPSHIPHAHLCAHIGIAVIELNPKQHYRNKSHSTQ